MSTFLTAASTNLRPNIEELKARKDPEALKIAVKELESYFAYEMIKAMRETVNSSAEKGFGNDTYMSMFDMELARLFADRGLGLSDMLLKGLGKSLPQSEETNGLKQGTEAGGQMPKNMNKGIQGIKSGNPIHSQSPAVSRGDRSINYRESKTSLPGPVNPGNIEKNNHSMPHTHLLEIDDTPVIPVDGVISSNFGMRKHPIHGDNRFHNGVDIAATAGTNVYPFRKGRVIFSGEQSGYGNVVTIDHGNGIISKYGHNMANLVKEGDDVDTNTVIAQVGSTGHSTGPHLHFEVKYDGEYVNPLTLIAKG